MRLLVAALALAPVVAVPAASAGPLAACEAYAEVPDVVGGFYNATATGGFHCDTPRPWLSVEVCLEVLGGTVWEAVGCETASAVAVSKVSASVTTCRDGLQLLRGVATGTASTGETGRAESPPVPFYCSPI